MVSMSMTVGYSKIHLYFLPVFYFDMQGNTISALSVVSDV